MSAAPDPADLAPSRDPAAYGKRPLFTATFFAWVSLCVICVLAGTAIGRYGLDFSPTLSPPPQAQTPGAMPSPVTVTPTPATLQTPVQTPVAGPADTALEGRVAQLETSSSRTAAAAILALAAATLSEAAEGPAPFDQDLAAYERLAPGDPDLAALAPLAARGAPTRSQLADALPDLASQAAADARQPAKDAGFLARFAAAIGRVVIIRRLDPTTPGVDGLLARAEAEAGGGDLAGAVRTLQGLPPAARAPLAEWTAAADRRLEIDRRIDSLRARALVALTQPAGARP